MTNVATVEGSWTPRTSAFLESVLFIILPILAGYSTAKYAGMLHGATIPFGVYVAAYLGGLLVGALLAVTYCERGWWRALRHVGVAVLVGAHAEILDLSTPQSLPSVMTCLALLLALLVGPDLAGAVRMVRASTAAGEDFMFEQRGLSRTALVLALLSIVAAVSMRKYVGSPRTTAIVALLLLLWAAWRYASGGPGRVWGRLLRGGVVLAAGVGALAPIAMRHLKLPPPRRLWGQKVVEAAVVFDSGSILWVAPHRRGATIRLHDKMDLPYFEAGDEVRLAESLVHPAAALLPYVRNALVIGNESGAVSRELLKYPEIERVVHVSLQPGMTRHFLRHPLLRRAHGGALLDRRVERREAKRAADLPKIVPPTERFDLIISGTQAPLSALKWILGPQGRAFFFARLHSGGFAVRWLLPLSMPEFAWCFVYESGGNGWYSAGYRVTLTNSQMEDFLVEMMSPVPFSLDAKRHIRVPTSTLTEAHLDKMFLFGKDYLPKIASRGYPCADELAVSP